MGILNLDFWHEESFLASQVWARQVSNLRPVGYEPTALPLSYGPSSRSLFLAIRGVKKADWLIESVTQGSIVTS